MGLSESKSVKGRNQDGIPFVIWNETYHFAEPSSYIYESTKRQVGGEIACTDPVKADEELQNVDELSGRFAIVERGGRLHFPDMMRRLFNARIIGCIFIERTAYQGPQASYEGFHSSGRQKVSIPIVRLSKLHADLLLEENPTRIQVRLLSGKVAIEHFNLPDDIPVGIAVAARQGESEVLKYLLMERKTNFPTLEIPGAIAYCDSVENSHIDCMELLHEFGVSVNTQKPNGTAALAVANAIGNIEAMRALVMYGANVDLEDVHGMTPLMIATRNGHIGCIRFLLRKGACLNLSRNRTRGTTALHIAAFQGLENCLAELIRAGAELEIESPNSSTALMEAARSGHLYCAQLLVEAGAKLDAKDREGNTAETLAANAGFEKIEDYLRSKNENADTKDQRRNVEYLMACGDFTLKNLLSLADEKNIDIDILKREALRSESVSKLFCQQSMVYEVFRLMTTSPDKKNDRKNLDDEPYGLYKTPYFCCEIALWYDRKIFEKSFLMDDKSDHATSKSVNKNKNSNSKNEGFHEIDKERTFGYFKVLFNFLKQNGPLDEVLLVLFCKVMEAYILRRRLGSAMIEFLCQDGKDYIAWIVKHIGYDSIKDMLVWLIYSDLSKDGQQHIYQSKFFSALFTRCNTWQRTLSWGVGTIFQRDSIENICNFCCHIIYPPAVSTIGDIITYVDRVDDSLPLITAQGQPHTHNNLFKSFLIALNRSHRYYGIFIDLGISELKRQVGDNPDHVIYEGGSLSIIMCLMSTLGYHKSKRDLTDVEELLFTARQILTAEILPRLQHFMHLCRAIIVADTPTSKPVSSTRIKGNALLTTVSFLKRSIFMINPTIDSTLAALGCMPCLLECYRAHPNNSLLHHELTDVIRFILLDPIQSRVPTCPLLNSLFFRGSGSSNSILDFVIDCYTSVHAPQYRGHMTTVANSVTTLTNTPTCGSSSGSTTQSSSNVSSHQMSVQEVVRQYAENNPRWRQFETQMLATQNHLERQPLGHRHAPLCNGCLALKETALTYVGSTLDSDRSIVLSGYLETIFAGTTASHHCQVQSTSDFILGYVYKKDKVHDHIPIPEPTRVSSFIQYPVPMPFHALTFTITFMALCRKCEKIWYCDSLQYPNWHTRMKWIIPASVQKWYSFGSTDRPGGGAHGIQFSTRGYKNFLVVTDTWGRQEKWMRAMDESRTGISTRRNQDINWESAMAFEVDNEVDNKDVVVTTSGSPNVAGNASTNSASSNPLQRKRTNSAEDTPRSKGHFHQPPKTAPSKTSMAEAEKSRAFANLTRFELESNQFKAMKPLVESQVLLVTSQQPLVQRWVQKPAPKEGLGLRNVASTSDLQALEKQSLQGFEL